MALVIMNTAEKFAAIVDDIKKTYPTGQPILVGTTSILPGLPLE